MTDTSYPVRLEVSKEGSKFMGTLVFSNGDRWPAWQVSRTLKRLTQNARCTFDGPIIRLLGKRVVSTYSSGPPVVRRV